MWLDYYFMRNTHFGRQLNPKDHPEMLTGTAAGGWWRGGVKCAWITRERIRSGHGPVDPCKSLQRVRAVRPEPYHCRPCAAGGNNRITQPKRTVHVSQEAPLSSPVARWLFERRTRSASRTWIIRCTYCCCCRCRCCCYYHHHRHNPVYERRRGLSASHASVPCHPILTDELFTIM
jgi:hypothetical protein